MNGGQRTMAPRSSRARDRSMGRAARIDPVAPVAPVLPRPITSAPFRVPAYMARDLPSPPEVRPVAVRVPAAATQAQPTTPEPSSGAPATAAPSPAEAPAEPVADAGETEGEGAASVEAGEGEPTTPEETPGEATPGEATAGEARADGAEPVAGAPAGAGAERRRSRLTAMRAGGGEPVAEASVEPTRGSVSLPRAPMVVPPLSATFDASGALDLRPERPPDPRREPPSREWLTHREVFSEAIAAARRLYDSLLADGARFAAAARAAEDSNASRRQADLDADLSRLTQGLDEARAMVRQTAAESLRMLRRRAGGARARISRASGDALAALQRAENTLTIQLIVPRATKAGILAAASSAQASVTANGAAAATALKTLGSNAGTAFPDSGGALASAQNEAIAVRLPARVARRAAFFDQERGAQEALLRASFGTLGTDFDQAFAEVDQMAANVSTKGRTAVQTARGAAIRQLDSAVHRMGRAIEEGAASADAALVQQHENSRNRLIEGATERGRGETRAAARRATSEGEAVAALAGAQGKAISAVTAALAPNRTRPAVQFARAVIGAATGMRVRLADIDTGHRTRLARTAADGRAGQERQSRATAAAVAASTAGMARNLNESARQRAEQMRAETDQGSATFPAMAEPVSASIASYMPPVGQAYLDVFTRLTAAITATSTRVANVLTGARGEGPPNAATAGAPPAPSPPTTMAPNAFITLGEGVAADAKTDEKVADLITRSNAEVPRVITSKSTAAHDALGVVLSSNVDAIMAALRAITQRQGTAIKDDYDRFGIGLEAQIRRDLPSSTSLPETNERNVNAAINYLNGNAVAGALDEMKAAVIWWNNEARVEAAQRNLTPEQMGELQDLHAEDLADIGGDLDEADASVFNALGRVDEKSTDAERNAAVGRADAVRLRSGITSDRDTRGDPGADLVVDRLLRSASSSGGDPIAGGDPLGLEEPEVREARRAESWLATQRQFGRLEGASAGEIASDPAAALIRFATAERDYQVFVPDDYPRTHDDMGPSGHYETRREGVSRDQARLIGMAVRENPGSTRTAGAIVAVENSREGKPRMDRLDMALHDPSLDAREGESSEEREAARPERERRALERRNEIWGLADQYVREGEPGPVRTPDQMRDYMADRMRTRLAGDASAIEYATSMVQNLEADPQAGFRYAMDHPAEREATFKRITGRMDRSQIDTEVARWDANRGSRPPLYQELGLFQQESTFDTWWNAKLSGDARNDVEISFMGVPRNDLERAEVARHVMQQQVRDAGVLGPLFAYGDYSRMVQNLDRLQQEMGVKPGDIDRFGRVRRINPLTGQAIVLGRFNERGEFVPGPKGSREAFESSIHLARLTAESYKLTTDRAATAVVTGLVVIAAVVTTVLTGGAAASIWIPVLVTAGAGLAGMAMSMAIRGDRYTRSEFERDFVMTIVQAATAGAGAAVGTAIRGGMPALRAAASRMAVADDVIMGFAKAAGRRGALTLTQEALVAGGSNAINSAAGAAMDPNNRMLGKSGEEALSAGIRGFFGGAAGSALMRPIMRVGVREPAVAGAPSRFERAALGVLGAGDSTTRRALGSAFSSAGTRAAEIGVDRVRGRRGVSSEATAGEIRDMFLQGLLQGALERRGEVFGDRMRARRAAARTPAAAPELPAPVREPPPPPPPPQRDAPVTLPPQVAHAVPPGLHGTVGDAARAARHAAPVGEPAPAPPRPIAPLADPTLPRPIPAAAEAPVVPRAVSPDDEPTLRIVRPPAEEPVEPTRQPTPPSEEAEPPTLRRPAPIEEAEPPTRRRPPPLPEDARQASARRRAEAAEPELVELPETSAMMPPDPRSRAQAEEMFRNSIRDDPSREVGLYVNSVTGEHVLIQGTETRVIVAGDDRNPVGIAGEGHPQRWKELLDADRGEWNLVAHNHPGNADDSPDGWRTRLPSGRGGDFSVMMAESSAMGGATRHSKIAVMHEGRPSITEFAYDPSSPRPFAIIYDDPATGQRVFRRFKSLEGYGEFFERRTGVSPDIDTPSAPAATRRPDEITLLHGTSAADAASIRQGGIVVSGKKGRADDFGAGFYLTFDTANAEVYAADRARRRAVAEGVPHAGEVLEFRLRLDELGVRIDVRPGGEHRAAWEAFMAVPRGGPPDFRPTPPALIAKLEQSGVAIPSFRDVISGPRGAEIRGAAFDAFLASIGMSHADVVHGDLGGVGTMGIHMPGGGEQIAIRTPEAAARLTAAMQRGSGGGGGEPATPASSRRVPPPEAISPPPVPRSAGAETESAAARGPGVPGAESAPAATRTRAHDVDELFAEIHAELDRPAPAVATGHADSPAAQAASRSTAPPEAATVSQATVDRLQAGARQTADAALAEMRGARGAEAAGQLEELILLAPRVMLGAPETEVGRGPRWRVGLLDASTETIRDRRFAELPGALGEKLVLDPPSRARLAELLRARRAAARPGESPTRRASEVEATIARWERQGMNRREVRAYEARVRRLETYAQGEAGFGTVRRASMRAEEDALRSTVDQRMRRAPNVEERDLLRQILRDTGEGWLAAFARSSMPLRGTRGWDVIEQWHAYLDNVAASNRANPESRVAPSREGFERYMRRYMKGTQRPRLSELAAAETVSQRAQDVLRRGPDDPPPPGLEMLKIALDIDLNTRRSRNEPSEAGTDYLGLRPGDGVLVYGDDKAHQATLRNRGAVEEVEAFVPNLATNMRADADMLDARFAALRARGLAVEDRHAAVPDRLRACAAALKAAFPRGLTLRGPRAQARFRNILAKHKVELIVTAAAVPQGVDRVAPRLARAGIRFLRAPVRALEHEEDEEPPE